MSRRTYGILAVLGSAIGAWWWNRHRTAGADISPRGMVIYDNTPTASTDLGEGII